MDLMYIFSRLGALPLARNESIGRTYMSNVQRYITQHYFTIPLFFT